MKLIKGEFTEIDAYNKLIENWDLKYKLLSKGDFYSKIEMVYNDDFSLVARTEPNAIIEDPEEIKLRVNEMIKKCAVTSINGIKMKTEIQTICLHGDHTNAVQIAKTLYNFKDQNN